MTVNLIFGNMCFVLRIVLILLCWMNHDVQGGVTVDMCQIEVVELREMLRTVLEWNRDLELQMNKLKLNDIQCQTNGDDQRQLSELRAMLHTVLRQNKQLEQQNYNLKKKITRKRHMCRPRNVAEQKCTCNKDGNENSPVIASDVGPESPSGGMSLFRFRSSGAYENSVNLSVQFIAPIEVTPLWFVGRSNSGMVRTNGVIEKVKSNHNFNVTSHLHIESLNTTDMITFRLHHENRTQSITVDVRAIGQEGEILLPVCETISESLKFNAPYFAHKDKDLYINTVVNGNKNNTNTGILSGIDVSFVGLNISASPPSVFELSATTHSHTHTHGNEPFRFILQRLNNGSTKIRITLEQPYAQYGGIMTFSLPLGSYRYIRKYFHAVDIKIFSPTAKEIVPFNNVGLYPLTHQTIIYPPSHSIMCIAMGNPRPEVAILKIAANGIRKEMPTETLVLDNVSNMKVYTLHADDREQAQGIFICRAISGNSTAETTTEAIVPEPIIFDPVATGVAVNTKEILIITCTASGRPRPFVEMRLHEHYQGSRSHIKLEKTPLNETSMRVTLTVSPVVYPVHAVNCTAYYGGANGGNARNMVKEIEIEVFPIDGSEHKNFDWL